jgi:hypothetical protein
MPIFGNFFQIIGACTGYATVVLSSTTIREQFNPFANDERCTIWQVLVAGDGLKDGCL